MIPFVTIFLQIFLITTTHEVLAEIEEARETHSCQERALPGYICDTCEVLAICLKLSTGWVNVPVENCDTQKGFYCNSNLGSCSNATGPCHPFGIEGNFPCTSKGVFPDPYDCQKYHMCYFVGQTLVAASVECGANKAFNPATGDCSLFFYDQVCIEPQFYCDRSGDARPWPGNPNIFYVCHMATSQDVRLLYPTLYRCNAGEIFDGYACQSGNDFTENVRDSTTHGITTTTAVASITDATTENKSTNQTPFLTTTNKPEQEGCTQVGLHPDPKDCRSYFYCSAINGTVRHIKCPNGSFFNAAAKSCVLGSC